MPKELNFEPKLHLSRSSRAPCANEIVHKSMRVGGHSTSLRLERYWWEALEKIAGTRSLSVPELLSEWDSARSIKGIENSFASYIRVRASVEMLDESD